MAAIQWEEKFSKALRDLPDAEQRVTQLVACFTVSQTRSVQVWPKHNQPVAGNLSFLPDWITENQPLSDQCYQMDYSSALVGSHLRGLQQDGAVLDLCASPGGKSVLAYGFVKPHLLVGNEVIGKRLGALTDTIERLELFPAMITRHDPSIWREYAREYFSVVLVDAPCSGQSLCFRGVEHPAAWYAGTVSQAVMRQRRILAAAAATVQSGGYLLYSTCTFSRAENEGMAEWFCAKHLDFETVAVPELVQFRSTYSELACSRFWPGEGYGAGGFAVLLRKKGEYRPHTRELPQAIHRIHTYEV
jgi:16S rRNA C967 or C1407 C5-methylase (RsmB/RsmF family)